MSVYILNGVCEALLYLAGVVALIPLSVALVGYINAKTEEVRKHGNSSDDH